MGVTDGQIITAITDPTRSTEKQNFIQILNYSLNLFKFALGHSYHKYGHGICWLKEQS